jgi:hypothetical protein
MDDYIYEVSSSVTERRLRRLFVPAPDSYATSERIDVIHYPNLELLWGPE